MRRADPQFDRREFAAGWCPGEQADGEDWSLLCGAELGDI